jgi:Bacteriophage lambda head decoration protein D
MGLLDTYVPEKLFAGHKPAYTKEVVIPSGDLSKGAVLGKRTLGAATGSSVTGTGNGTIGSITRGRRGKVGVYTITCLSIVTNSGLFSVKNPDGEQIGIARAATAFSSSEINFTLADGSTDFAVGDYFTITIAAGTGKYVLVDSTAVDGSGVADCILANDVDASTAEKTDVAYKSGQFNRNALSFGNSETYATHEADLLAKGIELVDVKTY